MFSKPQPSRRAFQRTLVHKPRAAFRKLAFSPIWKILEQVFACEQIEHGVAQKFQPLVFIARHRFTQIWDTLSSLGGTKFRSRKLFGFFSFGFACLLELSRDQG